MADVGFIGWTLNVVRRYNVTDVELFVGLKYRIRTFDSLNYCWQTFIFTKV